METFSLFHKGQKLQLLKFSWREPSKGENEKSKTDEIVTEAFHAASPAVIQKAHQELEEEMLDGIVSFPVEEEAKGVVHSVLGECSDEIIKPQQQQVAKFAAKQLIDIFLLERLIGKMSLPGPRFSEKEHSSMVLDSLMFDILLRQFFSIQQQQQATFENIPLRDFHLKAFTEVALDVILTELNKLAVEDMEDLREYERGAQVEGTRTEALTYVSES